MAQISKGDTFTDGQQVTGARLNQLVDSSTLLIGAITEQGNLTPNTLEATDSTIVNDGGVLKEATIGDILNSNLPVTTSAVAGGAGVDLILTPAAGQKVDVAGAFEAESANVVNALTVGGVINGTGAIKIATGTQAQRPASPVAGHIRFNTTSGTLEVYSGTGWINGNTSGDANFTGLVNAQNFTLRNKALMWGVYDTAVYQLAPLSPTSFAGGTAYGYYETTITHTKPADELWSVNYSFNIKNQNGTTPFGITYELRYDDGTLINTKTATVTPTIGYDIDGYPYEVPSPQSFSVGYQHTFPVGTTFTGKKLRFYVKYQGAAWWNGLTGGTVIARSIDYYGGDPFWTAVNITLTLGKTIVSNYP